MLATLGLCLALQDGLVLTYETSGGKSSGDYAEAVSYCRKLEALAPECHVFSMGRSASGREMIALTVSRSGNDAAKWTSSGKPIVYIENGIHAGEIEGKDATLILLKDMLVTKTKADLLEQANFVIVPVLNVDGHERRTPYNRINQNGPTEMGWRANDQNLNLNRDWMKLDAPETRAAVSLINRFHPDFFFDNHTTDGADYPYVAMLGVPSTPSLDRNIADWAAGLYQTVSAELTAAGTPTCPYFEFDGDDPAKGIYVRDYSPRYSTGYWGARNRPSMLIETHMLKPYKTRVEATMQTMVQTIRYIGAHRKELLEANALADRRDSAGVGNLYVLSSETSPEKREIPFLLYEARPYRSSVTGNVVAGWTQKRVESQVTIQDQFLPTEPIAVPAGYAIPVALTSVIDLLTAHGLKLEYSKQPLTESFSTYRFLEPKIPQSTFEGRSMPNYRLLPHTLDETLPVGTAFVSCDQPGTRLLMQLLEPAAPDSLARWGFLNAFFERKEYFEPYAMEPIGAKMLAEDPQLKAEFDAALQEPKFAADPYARLMWLYERSPYADKRLNICPIVRLTTDQLTKLRE